MDCSLLGASVHGILQARILECVAISFSRGSSSPRGSPICLSELPGKPNLSFCGWSFSFSVVILKVHPHCGSCGFLSFVKSEWRLYFVCVLHYEQSTRPTLTQFTRSVLLPALRVVDGCKLQKMFNLKMHKHGSKEIQIVRDQILLKESGKAW